MLKSHSKSRGKWGNHFPLRRRRRKEMHDMIPCSLINDIADDPSGATDCTTHGINPKLVTVYV